MVILALDTTTRAGSVAVARGEALLGVRVGDPATTHGERLPGEIVSLLDAHHLSMADVDLYGVAAGPGSFTGLRVGIATIQGLALVHGRRVVAVSALAAIARAALDHPRAPQAEFIGVWTDAQRREVFGAVYGRSADADCAGAMAPDPVEGGALLVPRGLTAVEPHAVGAPHALAGAWAGRLQGRRLVMTGTSAVVHADLIRNTFGASVEIVDPPEAVAPHIATLAFVAADTAAAVGPHAVRPVYVRRPDAELARAART